MKNVINTVVNILIIFLMLVVVDFLIEFFYYDFLIEPTVAEVMSTFSLVTKLTIAAAIFFFTKKHFFKLN